MKRVSVILLSSRKEKDLVVDCIKSLEKTDYPKEFLHIVLVDNFSEDDVVQTVRTEFPDVHVIENKKNMGFAAGNNVGIFYAIKNGSDYVMILNNDAVVDPGWLSEALKAFEYDKEIGCVTSKVYLYDTPERINTDGNVIHFLGFAYCGNYKKKDTGEIQPRQVTYPSGAAMLVKREVIEEIGAFEEKMFIYHDDVEFGWRMAIAGYKTFIAPLSKVWHKYSFSKPSNRKFYLMERNRFIVLFENYKLATLLLLTPASLMMELGIYFYALMHGWILSKLKADMYFLNPKNLLSLFAERRRKKLLRKVKDKDIIKDFVGVVEFEDLKHPLLNNFANPIFNIYWKAVKRCIWW